jgi:uncharacterized membrane protein
MNDASGRQSAAQPAAPRIRSIDIVRGAVMVLMAIDHVRVYSGLPAGGATAGIFFTRWVTHFCAPAFVFLAGTSAFLYRRRHNDVSRFLLTRGAWLIILELTVIRLFWTFNFDFRNYALAGVIWVLGWSMIALAGLSKLPTSAVAIFGAIVVAGHNLLDGWMRGAYDALAADPLAWLWKLLYVGFSAGPIVPWGEGSELHVLYSFVPWVGVMALGFAFGAILTMDPARRDRLCLQVGLAATAAFIVLRAANLYGDPRSFAMLKGGDHPLPALFAFLNTTKYPASLQFLLMTLGPTIALLPLLERARGAAANAIAVFGKVPFFFYLLHIPLIHLLAIAVSKIRLGEVSDWLFANHPMGAPPPPDGYIWSLPLLYVVWAIAVALLYVACRWFAGVKADRSATWLRYL